MTKNHLYICITILIWMLGWWFFVFQKTQEAHGIQLPEILLNKPINEDLPQKTDEEIFNHAVQTADKNLCQNLASEYLKNACESTIIMQEIQKTKTLEDCDKFDNEDAKSICHEHLTQQNALVQKDPKLCQKLPEAIQENCIISVEKILLQELQYSKNPTPQQCDIFAQYHKNCLEIISQQTEHKNLQEAAANQDPAMCLKITSQHLQRECHDTILLQKAKSEYQENLCPKIHNPELKNQCQQSWQANHDNNTFANAKEQKNPELCNAIKSPEVKQFCHDEILLKKAKEENNQQMCDNIQDIKKKNFCSQSF